MIFFMCLMFILFYRFRLDIIVAFEITMVQRNTHDPEYSKKVSLFFRSLIMAGGRLKVRAK